jgi:hypothetical protein
MCNGDKKCAKCSASSADGGQNYNPKQVAGWINKHIYNGKATPEELKNAYPTTMVWLESKKLSFTGENIAENKDELRVAINDPNYLNDKTEERSGWRLAVLVIVFLFIAWWLFKDDVAAPAMAPASPAPPAPIPVPPPVAAPVAAPAAPLTPVPPVA